MTLLARVWYFTFSPSLHLRLFLESSESSHGVVLLALGMILIDF